MSEGPACSSHHSLLSIALSYVVQARSGQAAGVAELTHMTPPDSRQTIDSGIATGAALTQSSNPRYHCNLESSSTSTPAATELCTNSQTHLKF